MRARLRRALAKIRGNAAQGADGVEAEREAIVRLAAEGPRPLVPAGRAAAGGSLRIAVVLSWLLPGSGGHATILNLVRALESRGHDCSLWLHDPAGRNADIGDLRATVRDWFGGLRGPVLRGFADWRGADVVVATSWETVHQVLLLDGAGARAYLVQDHEPDFHAASAEAHWAAETYRLGLHCVTAGAWLAGLVRDRYGATASHFDLGVDAGIYHEHPGERSRDTVLFYARRFTPRRAVPLGVLALAELARRRPGVGIELFGDPRPLATSFAHRHLGTLTPPELARAYSRATVGMSLSLTNYSLIGQEMMACGLPSVELDTPSTRTAFGDDPPLTLAAPDPLALADAVERLLSDPGERARRREAGLAFVADRTWGRAAEQVEAGFHEALSRVAA